MSSLLELPASIRSYFGLRKGQGYTPDYLEFLASELSPGLSRKAMMAKVVAIEPRGDQSKSYVLKPPARWKGFRAGMHLPMAVEIDGIWTFRTYTISSTPADYARKGTVTITVKCVPEGVVSNWLFDNLAEGDWLRVDHAAGQFTLDDVDAGENVLMLAAGIGITPLYSMLRDRLDNVAGRDITLLYYCNGRRDAAFISSLEVLSDELPRFRMVPVFTAAPEPLAGEGRICREHLESFCPDFQDRDVLMCGPAGFMATARSLLEEGGVAADRIFSESFGVRREQLREVSDADAGEVIFLRSGQQAVSSGDKTLLELAEGAGLKPRHGCRAGVCHQCKSKKLSGEVVDIRSGETSRPGQEDIQLCISVPRGRVELEL